MKHNIVSLGPVGFGLLRLLTLYGSSRFKQPLAKARLLHIKANSGKLARR